MNNKKNNRIDGIKLRTKTSKKTVVDEIVTSKRVSSISSPRSRNYSIRKVKKVQVDNSLPVKERLAKKLPPLKPISFKSSHRRNSISRKLMKRGFPVLLGLIFTIVILNQFDSATIRVSPHRELVELDQTIVTKKEPINGELGFSMIAFSESIDVQVSPDKEEPSREKAQGTIRVFNDYSTSPQRLSPQTRFEAVDGKIFKLGEEGVVIPGKVGEVPGEVLVKVYADQPGQEYNIDVTDFSIPGFLEIGMNEKYAGMYALSTAPFTGGLSGLQPSISEELKKQKTQDLEMKIQTILQERLLTEKTPEMVLVENSASIVFKEPEFTLISKEQGTLTVTGTIYALLVNNDDLGMHLAEQELELNVGSTVYLSSDTELTPVYTGAGPLDYGNIEEAQIRINNQALFIWNIDEQRISEVFAATSKKNIAVTAGKSQSIGSLRITNHPRWREYLPDADSDIKIKVIE